MKSSQTLKERKEMMTALALIAPTIIVMVIFLYIPFVNALQTSFYKYNGLGALEHFVGLKNYAKVLADPKFVRSLWNTFYLILVSFLAIPIGFVFAYILYVGVPGKKIFNAGLFIPYLISMVVVGCIWRIIYDPTIGPVDQFLKMAGLGKYAKAWLSRPETALWAIAVTWIWRSQPFNMLIMYANITKMPEDFLEAAQIDGANAWQSFRYVTAPHIRTVVGLLVVLRTVWVFNNFDIIYMITGGGPAGASTTMPIFIYDTGWTGRLVGKASAASILLLLFLIILCVLYFSVINRWEKEDG